MASSPSNAEIQRAVRKELVAAAKLGNHGTVDSTSHALIYWDKWTFRASVCVLRASNGEVILKRTLSCGPVIVAECFQSWAAMALALASTLALEEDIK